MKSFWLELKSFCKGFKFLAFILVLLSYQAMLITQFNTQNTGLEIRQLRFNERYASESRAFVNYWEKRDQGEDDEGNYTPFPSEYTQFQLDWYGYETTLGEKIKQSFIEKDWNTYNRYMAEKRLLEWNMYDLAADHSNIYSPYISLEEYFGDRIGMLDAVNVPAYTRLPMHVHERWKTVPPAEQVMFSADYHLQLLREGLPPVNINDTSPWGFLVNYLRKGLPVVLGLIVLLMTVNILHREKKFGSIKSTLQVPRSRGRYLLRKVTLGFVSSLLVITIPQLLMFLGLGVKTGYRGLKIPVLLDNNFLNWSIDPEQLRVLRWTFDFSNIGLSQYATSLTGFQAAEQMHFIPLWQFMILAFLYLALFILLFTVVGILISILVKNEIFAQLTGVAVFAFGTVFGTIFPKLAKTPWDLFSKANVIPILEGNYYSTYLTSIAAMCAATALLFGLAVLVFRKQDIATG